MTCSLTVLLCVQIGYWNEKRGYVNTAVYRPTLEEFYGLQNRTYIVTTILVRLGKHDTVNHVKPPSCEHFSWDANLFQGKPDSLIFELNDKTHKKCAVHEDVIILRASPLTKVRCNIM